MMIGYIICYVAAYVTVEMEKILKAFGRFYAERVLCWSRRIIIASVVFVNAVLVSFLSRYFILGATDLVMFRDIS